MIEPPFLTDSPSRLIAFVHITIPRERIREVMGPGIGEVMATLSSQGIQPAGPCFTHHLRIDPAVFDFNICVPVGTPVTPIGRVESGHVPAARVARTIYHGPYENLGTAWGKFMDWIRAYGHTSLNDAWECYLKGPESSDDPNDWQTELNRPILESTAS
jgi:effector-binding domain-containing protein